ncbi:hypothetical protein OIE62_06785 [Streptomyces scopuliridis]|uniref:Uncharacterized protein n=1 Tax=Streptomyces scopuliridis TaxID=452529 RepID=A0ACD4ZU56_9ACTN|nr:hypothetical protein [Streptomyces scopuliridis]WSC01714.1 hypothetical protein OG835_35035 [Streptomyces scopuliridis]WSC04747.1 hypothetical protein OIE62_06785 [Streptomyces scopuliridis]
MTLNLQRGWAVIRSMSDRNFTVNPVIICGAHRVMHFLCTPWPATLPIGAGTVRSASLNCVGQGHQCPGQVWLCAPGAGGLTEAALLFDSLHRLRSNPVV